MKKMRKALCAILLVMAACLSFGVGLADQTDELVRIAEADIGKNGSWYGYDSEWCARVVKYWANQAGLGDAVPAEYAAPAMAKRLNEDGSEFHLTRRDATGEIKCWTTGSWSDQLPSADYFFFPQPGDLVFLETNGDPQDGIDHVGVCIEVDGFTVYTAEGNTGHSDNAQSVVSRNEYLWAANESKIWGFVRLAQGDAGDQGAAPDASQSVPVPDADDPADDVTVIQKDPQSDDLYAEVREIPQNNMDAVLVMDTSGSMSACSARTGREILSYAKGAALAFIDQAFAWNENYHIGVASFDSSAREIQSLTGRSDARELNDAVNAMYAGGQTNVAAGFEKASDILDAQGRADARQMIVLFSDGIHNCSGNPVYAGEQAMTGSGGKQRDIYTVGMVGALTEEGKQQVRAILDQPYAVRYIEIDDEAQIEGAFYLLGLAASTGDENRRIHVLRVRGAGKVQLTNERTGETLDAGQSAKASFGSVYVTSDGYEAIYLLNEDAYTLRVTGGDVRTIGIAMETLDGRATVVSQEADLRFNGNAGTRLKARLCFADHRFELEDLSFNPYTYKGLDPFTDTRYEPEYEYKVPTGIANLPNGGLVSQRSTGYSASVPNEANMPDRVHEQHLEVFNAFFESEGFIVESRTSYGTNYGGYTYFLGGSDMKMYRIPEDGGKKEKVVDKALVAYWVDETGVYFGDGTSIVRRAHGESKGKTIARHGVATGSNLSRMIRYKEYLYFVSAKDRCIYAVPYEGGDVIRITDEPVRCLTIAQLGNEEIIIYNTYDKKRETEHLRAIDMRGNRVSALDSLRTINTHYFNYAHGYLYYCKKSEGCALYRLNLNNPAENQRIASICASRIYLFDDFVVTTDDSKYYCVMRPDGSEFRTIYAPYPYD